MAVNTSDSVALFRNHELFGNHEWFDTADTTPSTNPLALDHLLKQSSKSTRLVDIICLKNGGDEKVISFKYFTQTGMVLIEHIEGQHMRFLALCDIVKIIPEDLVLTFNQHNIVIRVGLEEDDNGDFRLSYSW